MESDHHHHQPRSVGGLRSSASLAEIKFIIKTSILPPTPTACPSVKRIQKFLGGDSSFEQSMEFKPINAIQSSSSPFKRYSSLRRFSEKIVDKSSSTSPSSASTDRPIVITDEGPQSNVEDNERLDMNINGSIGQRLTYSNSGDVEKILKKPKLTHDDSWQPESTLIKSSSSTNIPEPKSSLFGIRSLSLTPSPSLFRKSYSCRSHRGKSSFIQDKLVVPTILITSTPIKDSTSSLEDSLNREEQRHLLLPSPLSKENMQIFQSECEMQDVLEDDDNAEDENMEFSFICEPSESECGDLDHQLMETSSTSTSSSGGDFFQPPLEPVFSAEPSHSVNSMTSDAALLKRCQSGPPNNNNCQTVCTGADVPASDVQVGTLDKDHHYLHQHNNNTSGNNKENEFLAPDKKCLNSKRVKSATVRVLHALTVSWPVLGYTGYYDMEI